MKLENIEQKKIANLLTEFIKPYNDNFRLHKVAFNLDFLYYNSKINCWVATFNHISTGGDNIDNQYSETFLGPKGIHTYTFDKIQERNLEEKWLTLLQKEMPNGMEKERVL